MDELMNCSHRFLTRLCITRSNSCQPAPLKVSLRNVFKTLNSWQLFQDSRNPSQCRDTAGQLEPESHCPDPIWDIFFSDGNNLCWPPVHNDFRIRQHPKPIRGHKATKVSHKSNYCGILVDVKPQNCKNSRHFPGDQAVKSRFVRDYNTQLIAMLVHKYFLCNPTALRIGFLSATIN